MIAGDNPWQRDLGIVQKGTHCTWETYQIWNIYYSAFHLRGWLTDLGRCVSALVKCSNVATLFLYCHESTFMSCKPYSYEHFQYTPLYMIRNAGASELPVLLRMNILSFCRHRTPRPFAPNDEFSDQMKVLFLEQLYKKDFILVSSHLKPSTYYCDLSWRDIVKNVVRDKCAFVCSVMLGVGGGKGGGRRRHASYCYLLWRLMCHIQAGVSRHWGKNPRDHKAAVVLELYWGRCLLRHYEWHRQTLHHSGQVW